MGFGGILRQATAVDVLIGPFVDSIDGDAEEIALTINQADVRLSKNGQTGAQKSDITAAAHDADGFYNCELDATDSNTVGQLTLYVHVAGALAVRHDYQVVEEAVYDIHFASAATGAVPVASIAAGAITAAAIATDAIDADAIAANAIDASALAADAVTEIQSGLATAAALAAVDDFVDTEIADIQARLPAALVSGRIDASVGAMAANVMTAAAAAADLTTELQAGLATAADLATVAGFVDTEVAAILADTDNIQTRLPAALVGGRMASNAEVVGDKTGYSLTADFAIRRNVAKPGFMFLMVDASNAPLTGLVVTATRSLGGAAFAACANAVVELSNGVYTINLAAGDLDAEVVCLRFTSAGANDRVITIATQTE